MSQYCYACMRPFEGEMDSCPFCGEPLRAHTPYSRLLPGTVLDGRYTVGRALGQGGFGITYIGRDNTLDLTVAVKEYYPGVCASRDNRVSDEVTITDDPDGFFGRGKERFLKEAQTLARFCDEPGIVGVRDYFEENGTAYIVMEYLDGITLKDYIAERGPLPMNGVLSLMRPIVETMAEVHRSGVVHRDISPDNILLLPDGRPKLIDFGAAREMAEGKSLSVMLKCGYAPEEQYRRKGSQGPWTDVYALCATMYFCLTGQAPEESIERFWADEDSLVPPSGLGAKITRRQEEVLLKGMSLKIEDRYPDMAALEEAFYDAQPRTLTSFSLGDEEEARAPEREERPAPRREREERPARERERGPEREERREKRAPQRQSVPEKEERFEEEKPVRARRRVPAALILLVAAVLLMLLCAGMLLRELRGLGSASPRQTPEPVGVGAQESANDWPANIEFVPAAPQATAGIGGSATVGGTVTVGG